MLLYVSAAAAGIRPLEAVQNPEPRLSAVSHGLPLVKVASIALSTETNGNGKHDVKVRCMTFWPTGMTSWYAATTAQLIV